MPERLPCMRQGRIDLETRMRGLTQRIGAREDRRASGFAGDGLPGRTGRAASGGSMVW